MSEHHATISWKRTSDEFAKGRYSREHTWHFDGGTVVAASPSPAVVPAPFSNPAHVDPEEAFVASISSCHMLWFVDLARRKGFIVDSYEDMATGLMAKSEAGSYWMSQITLHPKVTYSGEPLPSPGDEEQLHHEAHKNCFIANSVKTEVTVAKP